MLHLIFTTLAYAVAFSLCFLSVLCSPEPLGYVALLSEAAILATFGAALLAASDISEKDRLERVKENIDVFFVEILRAEKWRRWQFLKRNSFTKGKTFQVSSSLRNPSYPITVGDKMYGFDIPTVMDDFFDLPVFENYFWLRKIQKDFYNDLRPSSKASADTLGNERIVDEGTSTTTEAHSAETLTTPDKDGAINDDSNVKKPPPTLKRVEREMVGYDQHDQRFLEVSQGDFIDRMFAYECLLDSYTAIVAFRLSRLLKHLSIGLILAATASVPFFLWQPGLVGKWAPQKPPVDQAQPKLPAGQ